MKFPWVIKKKTETAADQKLQQIKDILFPPLEKQTDKNGDMFFVDSTCDMNLEAVITDLRDGYNDEVANGTLVDVLKRLIEVRKILNVLSEFDPEAKYIIVDNYDPERRRLEDIPAKD